MAFLPPVFFSISLLLRAPTNSNFHMQCTSFSLHFIKHLCSSWQNDHSITPENCPSLTSRTINSILLLPQSAPLHSSWSSPLPTHPWAVENSWNTIRKSLKDPITHMAPEMTCVLRISKPVSTRYSSSLKLWAANPLTTSIPMCLTFNKKEEWRI